MERDPPQRHRLALIFSLTAVFLSYFLSGFAALAYQILWVRLLTLAFGNTTLSVSAVLTAFMFGLALGSFIGGHQSRKQSSARLLLFFCFVEIGVAVTAWLTRPIIGVFHPLISFLLLFPSATLMGTTFPILSEWYARRFPDPSHGGVGWLYGFNTLGAVTGACATGFFLLPAIGITKTFYVAGVMNLIGAGLAYLVFSRSPAHDKRTEGLSKPASGTFFSLSFRALSQHRFFPAVLFLTGVGSFLCEIAWTRSFTMVIGSSTYAFTVMLVTYLVGLSLGGLLFGIVKKFFTLPGSFLSALLLFMSISILVYLPLFNHLPYLFVKLFPLSVQSGSLLHLVQFFLCGSFMLGPTLLMGFSFPWILSEAESSSRLGGLSVGVHYAVNTVGCIVGAVLGGLLFVPTFGSENTLVFSAWIFAAAGLLLTLPQSSSTAREKLLRGSLLLLVFVVSLFRPRWDPYVLSSGAFLYAPQYARFLNYDVFLAAVKENKILFYKEGLTSNVSVMEMDHGAGRFLRINGKTDASSNNDMKTQLMLGYLPLLLHPGNPESALVIGLGSGVTIGGLATDQTLKKIVCVELEPVVADAQSYFINNNRNVAEDKRLQMVFADARRYLATGTEKFDLISSEPSNPWMAGVSNLYTREAFELAKNRLNEGGVFCQWFHSYAMGQDDFMMVIKTFTDVFPHSMLFTTGNEDFLIMGSAGPWSIDYKLLEKKYADNTAMANDLSHVGLGHPFTLMSVSFLLDDADMRSYSKNGVVHVDDHPILEFSAPKFLHHAQTAQISRALLAAKTKTIPDGLTGFNPGAKQMSALYNATGEAFMRNEQPEQADQAFNEALKLDPSSSRTWTNKGRVFNIFDKHMQSEQAFKKAISLDPQAALPRFHLGMLYLQQGLENKGLEYLNQGLKLAPGDYRGALQVAQIYARRGEIAAARRALTAALAFPAADPDLDGRVRNFLESLKSLDNKKPPPA